MFLTHVPAHHERLRGLRSYRDRAVLHRRVMSLFGDLGGGNTARERGNVLFRVTADGLLVSSTVAPAAGGVRTKDASALLQLPAGVAVQGAVVINPALTKNRTRDGSVRRTRETLPEDEVPNWLAGRLSGMRAVAVRGVRRETVTRAGTPLVLDAVTFDAVTDDPAQIGSVLTAGIGKAKAYGAGMVTLAPRR
ncbi:type I-E CRISPR-associated protein Cas6/Cse3/CasE [Nocardioides sp. GY 10113]|uniref:type I-E CRISPR-associated protein Cas6/Cse3/CasE n=1 Tax=Nocardioides sp. GY 10113 TaxID=2569761 RepID=UPI0014583A16|nr:type I-E CRISPR-associated protein Cas6/Cse3/CasE [Nocardioides sp. GY 10113]